MKMFDSIEELSENPARWGVPTLEEVTRKHYSKRDQMFGRSDDMLIAIDRGDSNLKCLQRYYIDNYRVTSLEQAERISRDMGYRFPDDFIIDPQLRPDDRGGFYNQVTFRSKDSIAKRAKW